MFLQTESVARPFASANCSLFIVRASFAEDNSSPVAAGDPERAADPERATSAGALTLTITGVGTSAGYAGTGVGWEDCCDAGTTAYCVGSGPGNIAYRPGCMLAC